MEDTIKLQKLQIFWMKIVGVLIAISILLTLLMVAS
jgi:hypothetical protein